MIKWDRLLITVIDPDGIVLTSDECKYTLDAENRMVIFAGRQGETGERGPQGPQGPAGINAWGSIAGTLSDQADLQTALDAKADEADLGTMAAEDDAPSDTKVYGRKDGDWAEVVEDVNWGDIGGFLGDQTDLIDLFREKLDILDVAPVFSESGSYHSGDYVYYNGDICKFTADHSGAWTGTDVQAVLVMSAIKNIEQNLGTMSRIDDAPSDGNEYARKNGGWAVVTGGGGGGGGTVAWGSITGTLSVQTDLNNVLTGLRTDVDSKVSDTGDTMTGDLIVRSTDITSTTPASTVTGKGVYLQNAVGTSVGGFFPQQNTDGSVTIWAKTGYNVSGSGASSAVRLIQSGPNEPTNSDFSFKEQISDNFDSTATYAVGDYCIYNMALYRFTSAHTGAWSSADVTAVNVADELKRIATGGGTVWGGITGTLSDQTDLATALGAKANSADLGDLATQDTVDYTTDVTNKPSLGTMSAENTTDYYTKTATDSLLAGKADTSGLGDLAALDSIDYSSNKLTNKPTLGSLADQDTVDYATEVTNKPTLGALAAKSTVDYTTDITNTPTLGALAAKSSVDYATEVTNKPTLGALASADTIDYTSNVLTNKPTLGSLASADTIDYSSNVITNKPTLGSLADQDTVDYATEVTNKPDLTIYAPKPLTFTDTITAGTTKTFSHTGITSTMRLFGSFYGTPENVASDVTWTTASGSITFTGTFSGSTTVTYSLIESN